jgi:hypothetical protein
VKHLKQWRVELSLLALAALAVFLLIEQWNIRSTLIRWLRTSSSAIVVALGAAVQRWGNITLSNLIGFVLIVLVLLLARRRVRWRLTHTESLTRRSCPKCGSSLHRIHRTWLDRTIDRLVAPVHRYKCSNHECSWKGLRVDARKSDRAQTSADEPSTLTQ